VTTINTIKQNYRICNKNDVVKSKDHEQNDEIQLSFTKYSHSEGLHVLYARIGYCMQKLVDARLKLVYSA